MTGQRKVMLGKKLVINNFNRLYLLAKAIFFQSTLTNTVNESIVKGSSSLEGDFGEIFCKNIIVRFLFRRMFGS